MKKVWIASVSLVLLSGIFNAANAEAIIKGRIRNVAKGAVYIQYKEAVLNNLVGFETGLVNDSFEVHLDLLDPAEVQVWIGQDHFTLFTLPEDLTEVDVDARNISGTIKTKGTHNADNEFLLAVDKLEAAAQRQSMMEAPKDSEAFIAWHKEKDKINKEKMDALYASADGYACSPAFRKYALDGRAYRAPGTILMTFVLSHGNFGGISYAGDSVSNEQVQTMLNGLTIERPDLLLSRDYIAFLENYIMYLDHLEDARLDAATLSKRSAEEWMQVKFDLLEKHFKSEAVRYAVLVNDVGHTARNLESDFFTTWANYIVNKYPGKRHNGQLSRLIAGKRKLLPGGPAPSFALEDRDGKTVSLASLKGKVVYLDFWGSWCIPCMYENRMVKAVKEANKGKDLVFVYITRDEDKKAWKEAIDKQELTGTHLYAGKSTVFPDYQANGVPHYVLIGKDGNIITSSAPRPSEKEKLQALLDAALQ